MNNLTHSQVYNEFLLNFKKDCEDYLNFHLQNGDRSKCPWQRDFNSLYIKNCQEYFGGKNDPEMSCNLEERINNSYAQSWGSKMAYQVYANDGGAALILVILTPLAIRVNQKIFVSVDNGLLFYTFFWLCYFVPLYFLV